MVKLKIALFLVLVPLRASYYSFSCDYGERCNFFIVYQLRLLFNVDLSVEDVPRRRLDELQLWNCFSYYPSVHSWDISAGQAGKYIGKDKNEIW